MNREEYDRLTEKEQKSVKEAVKVLYYTDSSDFGTSLYKIVKILTGKKTIDEDDIIELYNEINKEDLERIERFNK